MGQAQDITEFSEEFKELEAELDNLKFVYESLIKSTKHLVANDHSGLQQFQNSFNDMLKKLGTPVEEDSTPSVYATAARTAGECTRFIHKDEQLASLLANYAVALEKVSDARSQMTKSVINQFITPLQSVLETSLQFACKARKTAQRARLELDACRTALKNARSERIGAAQEQLDEAERQFRVAVEDALVTMRSVVENPETLKNLRALIESQRMFYSKSSDAFEALSME